MLEHPSKQRSRKLKANIRRIALFFLLLCIVAYQSANPSMPQQDDGTYVEQPQDKGGSEVLHQEQSQNEIHEKTLDEKPLDEDTGVSTTDESQSQEASGDMNSQNTFQETNLEELHDDMRSSIYIPIIKDRQLLAPAKFANIPIIEDKSAVKDLEQGEEVNPDNQDVNDEKGSNDQETQQEKEVEEPNEQEETTPAESEQQPSIDMSATEYTLGDIAKIVEKMNETERLKVEFTWDEEKFTEDSLFIDYIRDLMDRWYEEGKIERKWEPAEERFTSTTPYYTEEQGDYITLANLMYAEEGVLIRRCTFDEAILAHLFAGTVVMNRATDEKGRFGENLHDAIYTGSGYPLSTRNRVTNQECHREIVYVLAKMIIQYGPIGPESLIFQSQFAQGIPFARIDNQKFDLENGT